MFRAGEEGGTAIAEVLFGDYNPAGRLPYTVYAVQDIPPMKEYDITKGFTYMYFDGDVDWAFGYGLSYTAFDYSNISITGTIPAGPLTVTAEIRNCRHTRRRRGRAALCARRRSERQEAEEAADGVRANQPCSRGARKVSFTLPPERLAFWDQKRKAWILEPGAFEAMVGSSSADVRLRGEIKASTPAQWTPAEVMRMLPRGSQN